MQRGECMMRGKGPGPVFGNPARMAKDLGLSEEQVKRIGEINKDFHKKMLDQREKFFNDLVARGLSGVASVTTDAGRVASGHHSTSTLFTRAGGQMN